MERHIQNRSTPIAGGLLCQQIGIDYNDSIHFGNLKDYMEKPVLYLFSDHGDTLRPESRLLQLGVTAEELRIKITLGEALPQLAIVGVAYYGNIIKDDPSANAVALLTLSIPITDWLETRRKVQQHDIAINQARMMQDHYSKMMSLEEEKAYSDMIDAWTMLRADSTALALARENYRLSSLNYQVGNVTLSEVLQAHALVLQAQNALTDHRTSYIVSRRRLSDLKSR